MGDAGGAPARLILPRFFVDPSAATIARITFDPDQQHQIRRVLRLQSGASVVVCDGSGDEIVADLRVEGHQAWGVPLERRPGRPSPHRAVWLYASALRGDRFSWLLQKGTEIGVRAFVPVLYRYTQQADYQGRLPRYLAIAREAAEQCERATLPFVAPATDFAAAARACDPARELCLLLDEREHRQSMRERLDDPATLVRLFIGPEGGLTDEERALAARRGISAVGMGSAILRSETAALVGAALALAAGGDLG